MSGRGKTRASEDMGMGMVAWAGGGREGKPWVREREPAAPVVAASVPRASQYRGAGEGGRGGQRLYIVGRSRARVL